LTLQLHILLRQYHGKHKYNAERVLGWGPVKELCEHNAWMHLSHGNIEWC